MIGHSNQLCRLLPGLRPSIDGYAEPARELRDVGKSQPRKRSIIRDSKPLKIMPNIGFNALCRRYVGSSANHVALL